jgi:hypothetical protein
MNTPPKWFLPVAIVALLWNLMGCAAYLADVMLTPADVAKMSAADQLLYAARPAWSVAATAIAVWIGALGCVGLILRKRWALPALITSLIGVLAQDVSLFAMSGADVRTNPVVLGLQGMVLLIAIGLILLTRKALARGWIAAK